MIHDEKKSTRVSVLCKTSFITWASGGLVAKNTLADAKEARDWRIHADYAQVLVESQTFHPDGSPTGTRNFVFCPPNSFSPCYTMPESDSPPCPVSRRT